jgi:hypothetical protein
VKNVAIGRWVIFLVLSVASIALYRACRESRESLYGSLADAVKAGEVTRGWLPDFLPESSRNIRMLYSADSARTWCAFEFAPDDSQRLREKITNVDVLPERVKHIGNPGVRWWPDFLNGDVDIGKFRERGFLPYIAQEPNVPSGKLFVLFAIDVKNGRGFFYRAPG